MVECFIDEIVSKSVIKISIVRNNILLYLEMYGLSIYL